MKKILIAFVVALCGVAHAQPYPMRVGVGTQYQSISAQPFSTGNFGIWINSADGHMYFHRSSGSDLQIDADSGYTTVDSNGSLLTQRKILNFSTVFASTDNSGATRTDIDLATGGVANSKLANSSLTLTAGSGLSGCGTISLGGSCTLSVLNLDSTIAVAAGGISVVGANVSGITEAHVTNLVSDLAGKQATGNYITSLTGSDGTATGPGAAAFTLGTSGVSAGSVGDATHSVTIVHDAKGRATSATSVSIAGLAESAITNLISDLSGKQATGNYITALSSGGDVTASGPGSVVATLVASGITAGTTGDATHTSQVTFDAKGRGTSATSVAITGLAESAITNLVSDLSGKQATGNYVTSVSGDATAIVTSGAAALTLASVISSGTAGDASHTTAITYDAKGRLTAVTPTAIAVSSSAVSGLGALATLSSASLTTNVSGILPVANGGTGLGTLTSGSVVVGAGTSTPTFVAPGTSGNALISNGTAWASSAITSLGTVTTGTWSATTIGVSKGGTGSTSLTSGGVLVGAGTSAPTAITCSNTGYALTWNGTTWACAAVSSSTTLTGDVTGSGSSSFATTVASIGGVAVSADPLTQYAKLGGRSGGQTIIGGTGTTDVLIVEGSSATVGVNTVQAIYRATTSAGGAELRMSYTTAVLDGRDGAYISNAAGGANSSNFAIGMDSTLGLQFGYVTSGTIGANYVNIGHVVSSGLVVASGAAATWGTSNGILSINGRDGLILGTAGNPGAAGGVAYTLINMGTTGGPTLGFYGVTPVLRQSSTGVTTVAGLITLLQNLGLIN